MKKQITAGIGIIACVAMCATVWSRSAEARDLPAEPVKTAVNAKIKGMLERKTQIYLSADSFTTEVRGDL